MKRNKIKILALLLAALMSAGTFASCADSIEKDTGSETESELHTTETEQSEISSESETEGETREAETEEKYVSHLEGGDAGIIELADKLKNGVNSYFPDASRSSFVMENKNAVLHYDMETPGAKQVASLKTPGGNTYLENTMDVFLRMTDGNTYYASNSADHAVANIYRLGYYYYDNRIDRQGFAGGYEVVAEKKLDHTKITRYNMTKAVGKANGAIQVQVTNNEDPWILYNRESYSADDYNMLQITMKTDDQFSGNVTVYLLAGDFASGATFVGAPTTSFKLKTDGQFHTYLIPLDSIEGYFGSVTGIRLDIDTYRGGIDGVFEIKELKAVQVKSNGAPLEAKISRHFGFYSDKLHETLQVNVSSAVEGVDAIGYVTRLDADTASKLIVKDKNGTHESLDGVDWKSAEYVGFDIKGAGVFGIILPYDGKGGSLTVTLKDGVYEIIEEKSPEGGKLTPSAKGTNNGDDFYMGHRIYTDLNHDFDAFLKAAEEERHPLGAENFIINKEESTHGKFLCYDSLRGIYTIEIDGVGGFNPHYLLHNNRQFNATFTLKGDGRSIYLLATTAEGMGGALECAALLNGDGYLIPVPLEVGKNFSDATSRFDLDDARFSETILPMIAEEDGKEYSVINMYHKWGAYLLKQISFITYNAPYYHLSLGVHESNCIVPYYFTQEGNTINTLTDHRAMSSPLWSTDPQHTYCGNHFFLQYTDSEGNYSATENIKDTIGSYGPIYADVTMDYISDDGKIKVTYNHMEMPQTDENRAFYEMSYEVLEDISFTDFAKDFSFYSATGNDPKGLYTKLGYLDKSNKSQVVVAAGRGEEKLYVLGDECPYVSFFDMPDCGDSRGYSNLSFLIADYEIIIGGKKVDTNFVVYNTYGKFSISLDLGEVTLKKGDTIKIGAILMPWGSQVSDYSKLDKNVRDVRENTLLNPAKATPVANCEQVDTAFLPAVRTTDGKSAEFTISGGENNLAVRVYGFQMLTVPVIEEKIDGEWQEVKLCSAYTPDGMGYGYMYDGYMVYYDGDGTFSYAFVCEMKNGSSRTFRIRADEKFDGWDELELEEKDPFFFDADVIEARSKQNPRFSKVEIVEENGKRFVRFSGSTAEAYISLFGDNKEVSGDVLVLKYRIPANNPNKIASFNFFTSTTGSSAVAADSYWASGMAIADGEWQVIAIDISGQANDGFKPGADGTYIAKYLRLDIFNEAVAAGTVFDLEYVALVDTINEALTMNADMDEIMVAKTKTEYEYVSTAGAATLNIMVDANQLYTKAQAAANRFGSVKLSSDASYVTFAGAKNEATMVLFGNNQTPSGQYLVVKYRIPKGNPDKLGYWNFFASTVNESPVGGDAFYSEAEGIVADGNWHVTVIDLPARGLDTVKAAADGTYTIKYVRFDVFNGAVSDSTTYDVAYVGLCDNLDDILKLNSDLETVTLSLGNTNNKLISTATGEEVQP